MHPHDISMILALVGESPKNVFAKGSAFISKNIYDVTTTHLSFKNNVHAHIHVSDLSAQGTKLVIIGSDNMAVFDDTLSGAKNKTLSL